MKFASNFKFLLNEKGLTQNQIALKLNTTQQTVSRWINGLNEPDYSILVSLANILNVSLDYLLGRENDYGVIESNSAVPAFTREQTELLSVFNLLPVEQQREVIGFAKALAY